MKIKSTEIVDTFAEAFKMWGTRVVITAESKQWAQAAARSMTGFATSVIGCKCEAGIERELEADETPDMRPGASVLLFATDKEGLGKRLVERIGQCVMTCPSTACYNGLDSGEPVTVGGLLRYFGDGHQMSKKLDGRRLWRIPVMDGEFLVDESFSVQPAVGGGNILILGKDQKTALRAARATVKAMREIPGIILPFPDGVVRSGSKVGSRYKSLIASTNNAYCPTLRGITENSALIDGVNCVLEIVIDGLDVEAVAEAMRAGMNAAAKPGIRQITAGNYGGNLGQFKIELKSLLN
ncbi:MAG TPA: formylmethanofuran--tetrahydromethanopterin N-formyltransferase [Gammaproteobacteria bacterium]|nr:formylmethanofuran--tetrahydromethanopterin N-formyltransferase [Gammaproteobacteria bacterium]